MNPQFIVITIAERCFIYRRPALKLKSGQYSSFREEFYDFVIQKAGAFLILARLGTANLFLQREGP